MKHIIIPLSLGTVVRNLLRTDFFSVLSSSDIQITLLTQAYKDPQFIKDFVGDNITANQLFNYQPSRLEAVMTEFAVQHFYHVNNVNTFEIRRKTHPKNFSALVIGQLAKLLGKNPATTQRILNIRDYLVKSKLYQDQFTDAQNTIFFSTHPYDLKEIPLIRQARKHNVPIIAMILSWDNITSHPLLPAPFDKIIVWNDFMKEQVIRYYHYKPEDVFVSGIPQFDIYFDRSKLHSREKFLESINGDPKKKIITYTTAPVAISPHEPEIIECIHRAINSNLISSPAQLLVRFHPRDNQNRYQLLRNTDIIFDKPGKQSPHYNDHWNPDTNDMIHLADTLLHSDIIINVASTITIDASAFDTPIINIGFDGTTKEPYLRSVKRYYYEYTHYMDIKKTEGFWLVNNEHELVDAINGYLKNPSLHHEGRQRIIDRFCYKIDGNSGKRIAEYLMTFAKSIQK